MTLLLKFYEVFNCAEIFLGELLVTEHVETLIVDVTLPTYFHALEAVVNARQLRSEAL